MPKLECLVLAQANLGFMQRLKKRAQFVQVNRSTKPFHQPAFMLRLRRRTIASSDQSVINGEEHRIGFTASKSVGKAVLRSRAKRRMRALWYEAVMKQSSQRQRLFGYDCVFIAKAAINNIRYADLLQQLRFSLHTILGRQQQRQNKTGKRPRQ